MDVFELRQKLIDAYQTYATSFMHFQDTYISDHVENALNEGRLWPEPQVGLNPAFESGGTVDDLVAAGLLHETCAPIFRADKSETDHDGRQMTLHRHQVEGIERANARRNYVLTTGTGSGKSLSYMVPIIDHVLRTGSGRGVKAIVVYPMNALANSQEEELTKFLEYGPWGSRSPVTFARYTGQEDFDAKADILDRPPDIILTNYVMLELILTRRRERKLVRQLGDLRFLVLDELHTYRGRQGADVALLVRRLREASNAPSMLTVGTSATMSTEGNFEARQAKVAEVASTIFGALVEPSDVVGETLRRATPDHDDGDPEFVSRLTTRLEARTPPPGEYESFVADPLSSWIESTFGLQTEDDARLVRAVPLAIKGKRGGASKLHELTGVDRSICETAIHDQLLAGYAVRSESGFPAFAFRLHQFLSRGDTVYASLGASDERFLTLNEQRFAPGSDRKKVLLPLAFCRECGADYYVVNALQGENGSTAMPRLLREGEVDEGGEAGFIYLGDWPHDPDEVDTRLPADWFDETGRRRPNRRNYVPTTVLVAEDGAINAPHSHIEGHWFETPFRFCLSCGVSYAGRLGGDYARLAQLGTEGRSTATTIMGLGAIRFLRAQDDLPDSAKKLLSFTDNRQDASLQAGHFNDFVQVTLLRSALWRAARAAGPEGLEYHEVAQQVFDELDLPFASYAPDPDIKGQNRVSTERALRRVLEYRIYCDLERGWRITQPNLEQCGLLSVEYPSLDELAGDEEEWQAVHPALAELAVGERVAILRILLDWMRRNLAIKVDVLDEREQERLQSESNQRLTGEWALEDQRLTYATAVVPRGRATNDARDLQYLSARGAYGQYLRRPTVLGGAHTLSLDDTDQIIAELLKRLKTYGLVELVHGEEDSDGQYQIPAGSLRWVAGDGNKPYRDPIRMPTAPDERPTNTFFRELYTSVGRQLVGIEAREHTAQVQSDERIIRENRFRTAELPVLFCSPTMELGVDIAQLNVVNMRNVPPTPANYAQRSGRAGRSGQPALVFTYAAAGSPHDQYYFRRPELMVAGVVEAPRLELANEDLIKAHVHAIWLAESGLDLGSSLGDVLDLEMDTQDPAPFEQVVEYLNDPDTQRSAKARVEHAFGDLLPRLTEAPWWHDTWIDDRLADLATEFDRATERWKSLYRAALQQADEQQRIKLAAATVKRDRVQADRLRREAENQLELLRSESSSRAQADFNSYRYFAAEGFLPGYSFPRLPLSAYIPGQRGKPRDYKMLQRPRFLAVSEFGPQSLIYHEGARYRVNRVIMPVGDFEGEDGTLMTRRAKRCESCGYLHPVDTNELIDVCRRCDAELPPGWSNLFRLQNVSTVRRDRISSDEEERQRTGYEIITGVRFAERENKLSVVRTTVASGGTELFNLSYGDTANIWRINLGWRRRTNNSQGFVLDIERGYWSTEGNADATPDQDDPLSKRTHRVIPFVEDSRNALLIEPCTPLSLEEMATLQAALKRAFQVVFQLEENEIAAEPLPGLSKRRLLLFYESAEGGAGVLRRLVDEPDTWRRVAAEALRLGHIDPDTGQPIATQSGEECEAACYECFLSYSNQPEHHRIDRNLVQPHLRSLLDAELVAPVAPQQPLGESVESPTEQRFLDFLAAGGFARPDRHHLHVVQADTWVDFAYSEKNTVVFVDGQDRDSTSAAAANATTDAALKNAGFRVIRFGDPDSWSTSIDAYPNVFGEGNPS